MRHFTGICLAVALSWSIGAAAQETTATQDTSPATQTERAAQEADEGRAVEERDRSDGAAARTGERAAGEPITVVGCIQRERDVFATRGITNDDVVMTEALITQGQEAFDRMAAGQQTDMAAAPGPYDAREDDRRGEVVVQHDGTMDDDRAVGTAGAGEARDRDRDDAARHDAADRDDDHAAGVTGATGTAGTYGGDRDADRDRTERTPDTAADAEALTRDDDRQGRTFNLTGEKQQELQGLVGRQVEVTGAVSFSDAPVTGSAAFEAQRQAPMAPADSRPRSDVRHQTPGEDEARATNTGGGWLNPDEVEAAAGRERLERKPQIEVTSFRDIGACETNNER